MNDFFTTELTENERRAFLYHLSLPRINSLFKRFNAKNCSDYWNAISEHKRENLLEHLRTINDGSQHSFLRNLSFEQRKTIIHDPKIKFDYIQQFSKDFFHDYAPFKNFPADWNQISSDDWKGLEWKDRYYLMIAANNSQRKKLLNENLNTNELKKEFFNAISHSREQQVRLLESVNNIEGNGILEVQEDSYEQALEIWRGVSGPFKPAVFILIPQNYRDYIFDNISSDEFDKFFGSTSDIERLQIFKSLSDKHREIFWGNATTSQHVFLRRLSHTDLAEFLNYVPESFLTRTWLELSPNAFPTIWPHLTEDTQEKLWKAFSISEKAKLIPHLPIDDLLHIWKKRIPLNIHTTKADDTPLSVAREFGVAVEGVIAQNMKALHFKPGSSIQIKKHQIGQEPSLLTMTYVPTESDTIATLSRDPKISANELLADNINSLKFPSQEKIQLPIERLAIWKLNSVHDQYLLLKKLPSSEGYAYWQAIPDKLKGDFWNTLDDDQKIELLETSPLLRKDLVARFLPDPKAVFDIWNRSSTQFQRTPGNIWALRIRLLKILPENLKEDFVNQNLNTPGYWQSRLPVMGSSNELDIIVALPSSERTTIWNLKTAAEKKELWRDHAELQTKQAELFIHLNKEDRGDLLAQVGMQSFGEMYFIIPPDHRYAVGDLLDIEQRAELALQPYVRLDDIVGTRFPRAAVEPHLKDMSVDDLTRKISDIEDGYKNRLSHALENLQNFDRFNQPVHDLNEREKLEEALLDACVNIDGMKAFAFVHQRIAAAFQGIPDPFQRGFAPYKLEPRDLTEKQTANTLRQFTISESLRESFLFAAGEGVANCEDNLLDAIDSFTRTFHSNDEDVLGSTSSLLKKVFYRYAETTRQRLTSLLIDATQRTGESREIALKVSTDLARTLYLDDFRQSMNFAGMVATKPQLEQIKDLISSLADVDDARRTKLVDDYAASFISEANFHRNGTTSSESKKTAHHSTGLQGLSDFVLNDKSPTADESWSAKWRNHLRDNYRAIFERSTNALLDNKLKTEFDRLQEAVESNSSFKGKEKAPVVTNTDGTSSNVNSSALTIEKAYEHYQDFERKADEDIVIQLTKDSISAVLATRKRLQSHSGETWALDVMGSPDEDRQINWRRVIPAIQIQLEIVRELKPELKTITIPDEYGADNKKRIWVAAQGLDFEVEGIHHDNHLLSSGEHSDVVDLLRTRLQLLGNQKSNDEDIEKKKTELQEKIDFQNKIKDQKLRKEKLEAAREENALLLNETDHFLDKYAPLSDSTNAEILDLRSNLTKTNETIEAHQALANQDKLSEKDIKALEDFHVEHKTNLAQWKSTLLTKKIMLEIGLMANLASQIAQFKDAHPLSDALATTVQRLEADIKKTQTALEKAAMQINGIVPQRQQAKTTPGTSNNVGDQNDANQKAQLSNGQSPLIFKSANSNLEKSDELKEEFRHIQENYQNRQLSPPTFATGLSEDGFDLIDYSLTQEKGKTTTTRDAEIDDLHKEIAALKLQLSLTRKAKSEDRISIEKTDEASRAIKQDASTSDSPFDEASVLAAALNSAYKIGSLAKYQNFDGQVKATSNGTVYIKMAKSIGRKIVSSISSGSKPKATIIKTTLAELGCKEPLNAGDVVTVKGGKLETFTKKMAQAKPSTSTSAKVKGPGAG